MTHDAAELYRRLAPAVLGYVRSQDAAEPEDLLGEIFLQVVRDLPRFDGDETAVRRWVFTIAHHRLIDGHRQSRRRPAMAAGPPPELPVVSDPDPFDPELLQALTRLTAEQREVVALRFVADLPIDAVAAVTGRSSGAVKALQHRALDSLARELAERWSPRRPPAPDYEGPPPEQGSRVRWVTVQPLRRRLSRREPLPARTGRHSG